MTQSVHHHRHTAGSLERFSRRLMGAAAIVADLGAFVGCVREPALYLHYPGEVEIEQHYTDLDLAKFWDYPNDDGTTYNWQDEWFYGWDDADGETFGEIGYTPSYAFNIRSYFTGTTVAGTHQSVLLDAFDGMLYRSAYDPGYWDFLTWNQISTPDGVQSLVFSEPSDLSAVTASTNMTMRASRYQAPTYPRSFYQPEQLFSAYSVAQRLTQAVGSYQYGEQPATNLLHIDMTLQPLTYIYLPQVILHHNKGRITSIDGSASLSGMARSVNLFTGAAGSDAITVYYNMRFKTNRSMRGESVDIAGGRLLTFGMCNINGTRVGLNADGSRAVANVNDAVRHYMEVTMQFNNGNDSTFVFDVTDQVRRKYKGGVLTVELDMDTIPAPGRSGGSGFDAVVKDYEDGGTHVIEM